MSILATELIAYGSASLPTDDTSTSGGAIDGTRRPVFTQLTANAVIAAVSDGADTRTLTVTGRNAAGAVVSDSGALTGATEKVLTVTFERVQKIEMGTTDAARTVTVKQGSGGTTIATIPPNEIGFYALFLNSSSAASTQTRYEKIFWKNTNGTLTLNSAQVTLTADPASKINIGLATAINDTGSVANRTTAPASVTFVGLSTAQNVPGGVLAAGDKIGVWIKQSLASNDAAQKNTFTTQLNGTST
jgi:hypothetical protein